ncbi:hypothetical protein NIES970_15280 [[Synechococcus] sp. NIES-970]|uniref:DUF1997 domain-containing protein n=1 Tax=Picosynechococcus sp. NKBG15041c TaxID=1407650 RepID=UPI0004663936|nr:DUF1997 domain-containing protein [Picosynechococcus sp. NKBG15041c]BAW96595.1 hypothetical protein NIES970_15280 [[Synechococcus] sp. NIES-970]
MNPVESSGSSTAFGDVFNSETPPMHFVTHYRGIMQMYAPLEAVAEYLARHGGWFHRCAKPMQVEPFTDNGYILTVGRFGNFGYEVEPRLAVVFEPPVDNAYRMYNVPLPEGQPQGYAIDYDAVMCLDHLPWDQVLATDTQARKMLGDRPMPPVITQVNWELNLQVLVQFPKFIYKLPQGLLKSTGDRLLSTIISQVSPRLTFKVQQDFHDCLNLPLPTKTGRACTLIRDPEIVPPETEKEDSAPVPSENFAWTVPTDGQ